MRRAVCQATSALVAEGPFRDVTVDEIARAARLARSSFYHHFRDKYDVLRALTEDLADQLYEQADRWWHGQGAPHHLVRDALEGVVAIYAENASSLRAVVEVSSYEEEFREFWRRVVERFVTATAEHVGREQAAGRTPALDPDATASLLVWMTERACYVHLARGTWSQAELVEALVGVWTRTLYPDQDPRAAPSAARRR